VKLERLQTQSRSGFAGDLNAAERCVWRWKRYG